jgi:hypothetical protein
MFRLRYFTIVCNANEYKMMGQGASLGQLYDVQNEIKISKQLFCPQSTNFRIKLECLFLTSFSNLL